MLQRSMLRNGSHVFLPVRQASVPQPAARRVEVAQISTIFCLDLSATGADDRVGRARDHSGEIYLDERHKTMIRRRDLLLAVTASSAVAAISAPSVPPNRAGRSRDKRKPQYQANSAEVQTFYRVNRYPAK
jgi:hypothetical protein